MILARTSFSSFAFVLFILQKSSSFLFAKSTYIEPMPDLKTIGNDQDPQHVNGEKSFTLLMPGAKPIQEDFYVCTAMKINEDDLYVTQFEAVAEANTAHHMLLFGCGAPAEDAKMWECTDRRCIGESQIVYAWAKNAPPTRVPPDVAFHIGKKSKVKHLVLQVHYARVFDESEDPDFSGVKLRVTEERPHYLAGMMLMGVGWLTIPGQTPVVHGDASCKFHGSASIFPFAYRTHAHTLGTVITGYQRNDTGWHLLGKGNPQWPQAFYPINGTYEVQPGDLVAARCTFNSTGRDRDTYIGATHNDEMCNFYMMFYTNANRGKTYYDCWGDEVSGHYTFPAGSDTRLPPNPLLDEMAKGHHHHHHHGSNEPEVYKTVLGKFKKLLKEQHHLVKRKGSYYGDGYSGGASRDGGYERQGDRGTNPEYYYYDNVENQRNRGKGYPSRVPSYGRSHVTAGNQPPPVGDVDDDDDDNGYVPHPRMRPHTNPTWRGRYDDHRVQDGYHGPVLEAPEEDEDDDDDHVTDDHDTDGDGHTVSSARTDGRNQPSPSADGGQERQPEHGDGHRRPQGNIHSTIPKKGAAPLPHHSAAGKTRQQEEHKSNTRVEPSQNTGEIGPQHIYNPETKRPLQQQHTSADTNTLTADDMSEPVTGKKGVGKASSSGEGQSVGVPHHGSHVWKPYNVTVVKGWPKLWPELKLGQVSGVDTDTDGNVHIFHRATTIWDRSSFDLHENYLKVDEGPIKEKALISIDKDGQILQIRGDNMFYMPHGLTIDCQDNVWLTDVAMHQVFRFPNNSDTPDLTLGEKFVPGNDKKHFCKPTDVAVLKNGDFFVADGYCNTRIIKFDKNGIFIKQWGTNENNKKEKDNFPPPGSLNLPHSLALAEDNNTLCVADRENGRIQCFDLDGNFKFQIHPEEFGGPVYAVAYSSNYGGVLHAVTGPPKAKGFCLAMNSTGEILATFEPSKDGFELPHDIAVDSTGEHIYVAGIKQNRVWKFESTESRVIGSRVTSVAETTTTVGLSTVKKEEIDHKPGISLDTEDTADNGDEIVDNGSIPAAVIGVALVVPVILIIVVTIIIRLKQSGKLSLWTVNRYDQRNGFSIGKLFNRHHGFDPLNTEELEHLTDSDGDEIEEFSSQRKL